jgi:23S rRNA (uracil1939-C5)-methyltransferase
MTQNIVDITLEKLTYGGDALGRLADGRAIFVPFGLPGERVRARLMEEKRGFARAELLEVLDESPERIKPRCRHFGICGGCHYQHLSYENQLKAKTEILRDQLQRIGRMENPPVKRMVASPDEWNYSNQVQFHLTNDGKLGFAGTGFISDLIPITECHLPEQAINDLWPQIEFEPNAEIELVSLRAGMDDDLMLVLESETPETPDLEIEAAISITHVFDENTVVIAGTDHVFIRVLERDFKVSAASFFPVNTKMAGKMAEYLLAKLPVTGSAALLDIDCGIGLFSAFLAPICKQVIGIESSHSESEDFAVNLDEFNNVELYEGLAEEILPALAGQIPSPAYVLVEPPGTGIEKAALDAIISIKPQVIAYVSCDPSTFARDAARLVSAGYHLDEVTPFDISPQTIQIESIGIFTRA